MSISKSREFLGRVTMTRNELATVLQAQTVAYNAIRYNHTQAYIDNALVPLAAAIISKFKLLTKVNYAAMVYNVNTLPARLLIGFEKNLFRDILWDGVSSLTDLNAKWASNWLEVEVEWGFLELQSSSYGTGRYFQGNSSRPENGYRVIRVRTTAGWIILN